MLFTEQIIVYAGSGTVRFAESSAADAAAASGVFRVCAGGENRSLRESDNALPLSRWKLTFTLARVTH
jgi:hypothetical protein